MKPAPTFLILDDDEDSRFLARRALEKGFAGARILEASNPGEAIAVAVATNLDGIIADHHLGSADGVETIRMLRASGVHCPVLMVTTSSDPSVIRRACEAGVARVFSGSELEFVAYLQILLQQKRT